MILPFTLRNDKEKKKLYPLAAHRRGSKAPRSSLFSEMEVVNEFMFNDARPDTRAKVPVTQNDTRTRENRNKFKFSCGGHSGEVAVANLYLVKMLLPVLSRTFSFSVL